ncbi:NAD-dependent succinate-semialdehyde dehydrogenase [Nocardia cyriacigeorgica]|uniref:NAD-dependent succinate-semialdehyde dehydrogenase n=1 Tax=Nocardia cyriacigeorgica TaxID=135487 RepID=A0A6P1CWC2_9NOCA|nr:NAD-dependent succinate-semialdehyde dehydrogenase [Nocardia cyriacigeorgica]NEW36042.1 NAD-dependent succinate-semialdehyde dehydrogenase [Nocardia cyriacigeorgica]
MTTTHAPTTPTEQKLLDAVPTGIYIEGAWREASSGEVFSVEDPATGQTLLTVADGTADDALAALTAAAEAQADWARTAPRHRAEILHNGFDLVRARAEDFALLVSLEMGKPIHEARAEVRYGAEFLRWFSEETVRDYGRFTSSPEGTSRILVQRKAVGPCLLITPWNFPLAMATRKIAPALAAGCTMVVKPAQFTPLTTLLLTTVLEQAGLPAGVLNVVPSSSASQISGPLLRDSRLRKLSFTGSTPVGRRLLGDAATNVLRTSMELGGNAPFLVFPDADLEQAVQGAVAAKMRNMGQACTAANRFLVHESVAGEFVALLSEAFAEMKLGRGTDPATQVGPLINDAARAEVHSLVTQALASGAAATTGGRIQTGQGYFYAPTVLADVPPDAAILGHEIFGPVAPVTTFATEEQAISMANATEYGLAAYLYTSDYRRLLRLSEQLEYGMIGFNAGVISNAAAPFGGVKQSGLGREGGAEGLSEYTTTQYIGIPDPQSA